MMRNSGIEPFELAKSVVKVGKSNIVLFEKNKEKFGKNIGKNFD